MEHATTLALVVMLGINLVAYATETIPVNKSCVAGSAGATVSIGYGGARASAGAGA